MTEHSSHGIALLPRARGELRGAGFYRADGEGDSIPLLRNAPVIRRPLPQTSSPASPLLKGKSVTHVSGTMCYLCVDPLINYLQILSLDLLGMAQVVGQ